MDIDGVYQLNYKRRYVSKILMMHGLGLTCGKGSEGGQEWRCVGKGYVLRHVPRVQCSARWQHLLC